MGSLMQRNKAMSGTRTNPKKGEHQDHLRGDVHVFLCLRNVLDVLSRHWNVTLIKGALSVVWGLMFHVLTLSATPFVEDFSDSIRNDAGRAVPRHWQYRSSPQSAKAVFDIVLLDTCMTPYLRTQAQNAYGQLIISLDSMDVRRYPYVRWKWFAQPGSDTTISHVLTSEKDYFLAIGFGAGQHLLRESVVYVWDINRPKGNSYFCFSHDGTEKQWRYTVRNNDDATGAWFTQSASILDDFRTHYRYTPKTWVLTISTHSSREHESFDGGILRLEFFEKEPLE